MSVKNLVLEILENNKGTAVSGEQIAEKLSVSRNSVWKAINSLRLDGYQIEAVTNCGYTLLNSSDIVSSVAIKKYLKVPVDLEVFETIDSTNDYLKTLANKGAKEGKVVVSKEQTAGKGRIGRNFYSPNNTGVYFSLLLNPQISAEGSVLITTCAAVAVAEAVDKLSGKTSKIKWVNDIFINNKKVCGILTEASLDFETSGLQYAVLGIGINVLEPKNGFPNDIKDVAGAVFTKDNYVPDAKSKLIAEIINNFFRYYNNLENKEFLSKYKEKSMLTGKDVYLLRKNSRIKAKVIEITDNCGLKIKYDDGSIDVLTSGEVSVRSTEWN